ncbi:MAG: prepilin-type N-terminal cleavage/methylation domain-containing protein [Nitrosomonadaceae bacterium]
MSLKINNNNGITLLEILVAVSLLSIVTLGLALMAMEALQQGGFVKNRMIGITLARSKIDDLKGLALITPLSSANNNSEIGIDSNGVAGQGIFTRTVTITGGAGQLTTLNVTLAWTDYKPNTITQTILLNQ